MLYTAWTKKQPGRDPAAFTVVRLAYWVNTGKNEALGNVLKAATDDITERLHALLQGERVIARIEERWHRKYS